MREDGRVPHLTKFEYADRPNLDLGPVARPFPVPGPTSFSTLTEAERKRRRTKKKQAAKSRKKNRRKK